MPRGQKKVCLSPSGYSRKFDYGTEEFPLYICNREFSKFNSAYTKKTGLPLEFTHHITLTDKGMYKLVEK